MTFKFENNIILMRFTGALTFIIGFTGSVGALRENTCLLAVVIFLSTLKIYFFIIRCYAFWWNTVLFLIPVHLANDALDMMYRSISVAIPLSFYPLCFFFISLKNLYVQNIRKTFLHNSLLYFTLHSLDPIFTYI